MFYHCTIIPHSFLCEGHARPAVNCTGSPVPHFTAPPLAFDLTKDVLVSRSLAASAPLSWAKHKFMAHSCTGWGFLVLQWGRGGCGCYSAVLFSEVLCDGYREQSVPIFTLKQKSVWVKWAHQPQLLRLTMATLMCWGLTRELLQY